MDGRTSVVSFYTSPYSSLLLMAPKILGGHSLREGIFTDTKDSFHLSVMTTLALPKPLSPPII